MSLPVGKVLTVTGAVDPASLGPVLMHEHILVDARVSFVCLFGPECVLHASAHFSHARQQPLGVPAPAHAPNELNELNFDLSSLGYIRQFPYSHQQNLLCDQDAVALAELQFLHKVRMEVARWTGGG
jgi:predicted metal-dependent phosphotriesterase family hydrolase